MKKLKHLLVILIMVISSSCSVTFTNIVRNELENRSIDLKNVQFYNSQPIALQRELERGEVGIEQGKVKIRNDKKIEIIEISKKTPGICVKAEKNKLYIKFEEGENNLIPFSTSGGNNPYYLINSEGKDFEKDIENYTDLRVFEFYGTIYYEGKEYNYGYSFKKPKLLIKKKEMGKISKDSRRVKGLKVN